MVYTLEYNKCVSYSFDKRTQSLNRKEKPILIFISITKHQKLTWILLNKLFPFASHSNGYKCFVNISVRYDHQ